MPRFWPIWLIFAVCLSVAVAAMGWISLMVLRLDSEQRLSQQQEATEQTVRLALWRMDSAMSPIVAQENARPYYEYCALIRDADRSGKASKSEQIELSPLFTQPPKLLLLHFQFNPDSSISSPQIPPPGTYPAASADILPSTDEIKQRIARLNELRHSLDAKTLEAALPPLGPANDWSAFMRRDVVAQNTKPNSSFNFSNANNNLSMTPQIPQQPAQQASNDEPQHNQNEYQQRQSNIDNTTAYLANNGISPQRSQSEYQQRQYNIDNTTTLLANGGVSAVDTKPSNQGLIKALWIGDKLLLARRVSINGQECTQGCWVDWPTTRQFLLDSISDLLPSANLQKAPNATADREPRLLASLPVRLETGPVPTTAQAQSPVRMVLGVAWVGILLAALAVAGLLRGVMSLSERRAAFVSAVTHELRTPLTTLRMYAEMLAGGMVGDEGKRNEYVRTLHSEADRLGHLVENVLAYSRLERTNRTARLETVRVAEVIAHVQPRLAERANQAKLQLFVDDLAAIGDATVRVDPLALEQILFNLVDNACKYAARAGRPEIHVRPERDASGVKIHVRDFGPGLSEGVRRRLFRPFSKSVHEAANTAPGLGLGLALCRRLAREMHGTLWLDESVKDGAAFVIALPAE